MGISLKSKNAQTITQEFSNIQTTSKRSPFKIEKRWRSSIS